eukprot:augustus_masked-scaffold_24-processed-gene-5.68-mRNA-1 protein AED:1.00 eAED:1.00 QI:0/-1/0/0/-1/1/1/0/88
MCLAFVDTFDTSMSQTSISLLPHMDVVPIQGAPFKLQLTYRVGSEKAEFAKEKLDGMVEKDMAKKIAQAIYDSVVLVLSKKIVSGTRF